MGSEIYSVKKPMLEMASTEWQRKLDNTMLEQMVLLNRIDKISEKLASIEQKLNNTA